MMSRPRVRWLICVTRVVRVVFVYWARARASSRCRRTPTRDVMMRIRTYNV